MLLTSCATTKLDVASVNYQSVRTNDYKAVIPQNAKIAVGYSLSPDGRLTAIVRNLMDEILVVDQTHSYYVDPEGVTHPFFDPSAQLENKDSFSAETKGEKATFEVAGLFSPFEIGRGDMDGLTATTAAYFEDVPFVNLQPKTHGAMSKCFDVTGIGEKSMNIKSEMRSEFSSSDSYCKFSVCIAYSTDGGHSFNTLLTPFYVNAIMASPVKSKGKVNEALRSLMQKKTDAIHEQWWMLRLVRKGKSDYICNGSFLDWQ